MFITSKQYTTHLEHIIQLVLLYKFYVALVQFTGVTNQPGDGLALEWMRDCQVPQM